MPWKPSPDHVPARDLRASDTDRERVVELLREAHADGRLTIDEHAERVERAYAARTLGELSELTLDLTPAEQQPLRVDARPLTAMFGRVSRAGRWVVPVRFGVSALFGTVDVDLRDALLQRRHIQLDAMMLGGRLHLLVPEGVHVVFTGRAVLTSRDLRTRPADDGPVIEIGGTVVLGSVTARTPRRRWRDRLPGRS